MSLGYSAGNIRDELPRDGRFSPGEGKEEVVFAFLARTIRKARRRKGVSLRIRRVRIGGDIDIDSAARIRADSKLI